MLIRDYFKAQADLAREVIDKKTVGVRIIEGRKVTYYELRAKKVGLNKIGRFKKLETVELERR